MSVSLVFVVRMWCCVVVPSTRLEKQNDLPRTVYSQTRECTSVCCVFFFVNAALYLLGSIGNVFDDWRNTNNNFIRHSAAVGCVK